MLETWKQSYLEVRKKIEESGREARWEFDQRALFEGTVYMANICDGLNNSAQVLLKFSFVQRILKFPQTLSYSQENHSALQKNVHGLPF